MLAIPHLPPPMSVNGIVAELLTRMYHTHLIPAACRLLNVAPPHSQAALQTIPDITMVRLEVKCAAIILVLHKLVYGPVDSSTIRVAMLLAVFRAGYECSV